MGLLDKVVTNTTTTKSGMIVEKSYTNYDKIGESYILKDRKCIFPKGHHMQKTYGLDSLEITTRPKTNFYAARIKGNVLGREMGSIVETVRTPEELKGLLKTLKRLQNLPNLKNLSLVDDILKVARFIK